MQPDFRDPPPPHTVSMTVTVAFHKQMTMAENMDAATQIVRRQVEIFLNKARAEADGAGIDMRCDYLVTY
jgi:hypothetical protein